MAWEHLSITKPHLVYIILGGFTSLFMLCSSFIKERMYIGEATVATLCGLIFGPHAANLIDPKSWGSVDIVTIEFSRIVLVVQCFAVGVELPKFYMERHWKSVVFLLVPVMTFGWLITSLVIWWMVPPLDWLDSLVVAACVTATDPVLASSVVGKGKFAKRVPKHLRDLLSAESGCNDGMAFPFVYLSLYLIQDKLNAKEVTFHFLVFTVIYECIFGAFYGFIVGYLARHGIKYAEKHDLIDRESFLVFYFVLALFCAGSGSILGVDDLLVGFACGVGFSNDGWFTQKTEESHVSNVIDLLINLAYFVYFGTIIPWEQFNSPELGLVAWRLVVIAIFVIFFRRIPIMLALKPLIPDIKTWREALFAGHFGPIGVGAIFVAILARAELESDHPVPLSDLPPKTWPHFTLIALVWPIVAFIVVTSILVHGSSIAVFTLGKHINTLTITMSYTTAPEDGPSWMNRLPRISSQSKSQARTMSDTEGDELKLPEFPPGTLPPVGVPGSFLRRVKDEDNPSRQGSRASSVSGRRKRKKWDDGIGPGGPISQSAIFPQRRSQGDAPPTLQHGDSSGFPPPEPKSPHLLSPMDSFKRGRPVERNERPPAAAADDDDMEISPTETPSGQQRQNADDLEVYDEGNHIIVENQQGEVVAVEPAIDDEESGAQDTSAHAEALKSKLQSEAAPSGWTYEGIRKKIGNWRDEELQKRREKQSKTRRHEPARAYQFGNTVIVEDEDGEVVKKYELPSQKPEKDGGDLVSQSLKYMGMGSLVKPGERSKSVSGPSGEDGTPAASGAVGKSTASGVSNWAASAFGRSTGGEQSAARARKKSVAEEAEEEDDRHIRFTIGGVGQRMTKENFIKELQKFDKNTRSEILEHSNASHVIKTLANQEARLNDPSSEKSSSRGKAVAGKSAADVPAPARPSDSSSTSGGGGDRGRSLSSSPSPTRMPTRKEGEEETAVERRRREAALKPSGDDKDEMSETPAERRRREAALGMSTAGGNEDSDSDDDNTPRVPPARRGIRFADAPGGSKKH